MVVYYRLEFALLDRNGAGNMDFIECIRNLNIILLYIIFVSIFTIFGKNKNFLGSSVIEIGLSLKPNHHCLVKVVPTTNAQCSPGKRSKYEKNIKKKIQKVVLRMIVCV